jgi:hypothetical protein
MPVHIEKPVQAAKQTNTVQAQKSWSSTVKNGDAHRFEIYTVVRYIYKAMMYV